MRDGRGVGEQLMRTVGLGEGILRGEKTLGGAAVTLALRILLEGERDGNTSVAEILPVHGLQCSVGGFE